MCPVCLGTFYVKADFVCFAAHSAQSLISAENVGAARPWPSWVTSGDHAPP